MSALSPFIAFPSDGTVPVLTGPVALVYRYNDVIFRLPGEELTFWASGPERLYLPQVRGFALPDGDPRVPGLLGRYGLAPPGELWVREQAAKPSALEEAVVQSQRDEENVRRLAEDVSWVQDAFQNGELEDVPGVHLGMASGRAAEAWVAHLKGELTEARAREQDQASALRFAEWWTDLEDNTITTLALAQVSQRNWGDTERDPLARAARDTAAAIMADFLRKGRSAIGRLLDDVALAAQRRKEKRQKEQRS